MVMHHDHNHVVGITFGLFTIVRENILEIIGSEDRRKSVISPGTHVRPSDQIVRRFVQILNDRVFHDLIRQVQAVRVFDQSPARLATRSIPSHNDVILKIRDNSGSSVTSLDSDGFKEEVHGVHESFLRS